MDDHILNTRHESDTNRAVLSTMTDESDEREINRCLRAQYAEISLLAGGLAHEIRNPLSTMSLNLDLLAEDFRNPETPRERRVLQKIDRLRRESQLLQDILEDFLRFARVQELETEPAEMTDESDERQINRRLRPQYAEISLLAGGLAHEIRNPLSTMSLNLDLLAEDFRNPETPRERRVLQKIDRLRRESQRLQDILEDFLRFARVQELETEPADLNKIVDDLRDFCEPQATTKAIVIRTQYAEDLPKVLLDVDMFEQALLNLILNAQHAMPDGGELILRTRHEGNWNVLDVTDTGVGMSEDVRSRVFEAFYSTRPGGSGLGLPTTRKIVEAHGGTIHVQSVPGKGSQFTVRLPDREAATERG